MQRLCAALVPTSAASANGASTAEILLATPWRQAGGASVPERFLEATASVDAFGVQLCGKE
jgi:hypothetical protein